MGVKAFMVAILGRVSSRMPDEVPNSRTWRLVHFGQRHEAG